VLAEPHALSQNAMAGCQGAACTALELNVQAHLTSRGELLVVGAAVHAPRLNGTFLPIVATALLARN
jgi:hypothetical protein